MVLQKLTPDVVNKNRADRGKPSQKVRPVKSADAVEALRDNLVPLTDYRAGVDEEGFTNPTELPIGGADPSINLMNQQDRVDYDPNNLVSRDAQGNAVVPPITEGGKVASLDELRKRDQETQAGIRARPEDVNLVTWRKRGLGRREGGGPAERMGMIASKLNLAREAFGKSAPTKRNFSEGTGNEIAVISTIEKQFTDIFHSEEGVPGSIFSEQTGNGQEMRNKARQDWLVTSDNEWGLGGAMVMTMSRIWSQVSNHQLIKQATLDSIHREDLLWQEDGYDPSVPTMATKKETEAMKVNQERLTKGLDEQLHQEPILRFMLDDITLQMRKMLNPDRPEGELRVGSSEERVGAAAFLRDMTDKGYIAWGRDNQGRLIPLNTQSNPLYALDRTKLGKPEDPARPGKLRTQEEKRAKRKDSVLDDMNKIFFPDMRGSTELPTPKAQLSPPQDYSLADDSLQDLISTGGRFFKGKGKISEKSLHDSNHTAIGANGMMYNFMDWLIGDVEKQGAPNGFYTHELASILGEITSGSFEEYERKRGSQSAAKEIADKFNRLKTNMNEKVAPRLADGLNRFMLYYLSKATNRMFGLAADTNYINDKADVRATLKFGNQKPIRLSNEVLSAKRIIKNAEENLKSNQRGQNQGWDINKKLDKLSDEDMQILDYYYALGHVMLDLDTTLTPGQLGLIKRSPIKLIKYAVDENGNNGVRNKASALSAEINKYFNKPVFDEQGNKLPNAEGVPDFSSWSGELQQLVRGAGKGEAQYPLTVLKEYQTLESARKGNTPITHRFDYIFEQDARQSNAAIISLIMGDTEVGQLLGLLPSISEQNHSNLREVVHAGVHDDIQKVFTGENDQDLATAFSVFFDGLNSDPKYAGRASKIYARGIVVAGLYGKSARFMFEEAADMLNQVPDLAINLRKAYEKRGGDAQLERDIASIFQVSAKRSMENLLGYQDYMRSIGNMMGLLDMPSVVQGWTPNETLLIGYNNILPDYKVGEMLDNSLTAEIGPAYKRKTFGGGRAVVGGIQSLIDTGATALGIARRQREEVEIGQRTRDPEKNFQGIYGTNFRNALPVDLIQAGDAALMQIAREIATGNSNMPLNLFAIHDAAITTAGSTLKFNNAYNNIAFHILGNQAQNIFHKLLNPMEKNLSVLRDRIRDLPDGARVDIGVERIKTDKGPMRNFAGITDYFDTITEQYNSENGFFNEMELKRPQNVSLNKFLKEKAKEVLDIAKENGYIPYNTNVEMWKNRRARLTVSKKEFLTLLQLIQENEGLMPRTRGEREKQGVYEDILLKSRNNDKRNVHWIFNAIRETQYDPVNQPISSQRLYRELQGDVDEWGHNLV